MSPRRPRRPWRVRLYQTAKDPTQTDHTSSQNAYEQVIAERQKAERGETDVTTIRVLQWSDGDWALYERITPDRTAEK